MSNEIICIISLSVLCIYQSYRFWKLEKLVFAQFDKILNFQHDLINAIDSLINAIDSLRIVKELENEERNTND